jgi:hypothetical protein
MGLPLHTCHLVQRLLGRYCERLCSPRFERQLRLGFAIDGDSAFVYELRPVFGIASMVRRVNVARFLYRQRDGSWRLYCNAAEPCRWRPYPMERSRTFVRLLAEVDADPRGLFWGRVNGASLRWCSSRGRCADCEDRYRAVLGPAPVDPVSAAPPG